MCFTTLTRRRAMLKSCVRREATDPCPFLTRILDCGNTVLCTKEKASSAFQLTCELLQGCLTQSVLAWLTRPVDNDQQPSSSFLIDAVTTHRQYCSSHPDAPIEVSAHSAPRRPTTTIPSCLESGTKWTCDREKTLAAVIVFNGLPMLPTACSDARH